jgi:hypothetical protein
VDITIEHSRRSATLPESANLFARMDKASLTFLSQPIESGARLTGATKRPANKREGPGNYCLERIRHTDFSGNRTDGGFDEADVVWTDNEEDDEDNEEEDEDNEDDNEDDDDDE